MLKKLSYYVESLGIFLATAALIAGMVGCGAQSPPESSYIPISNWYQLDAIRDNLGGNYRLMNTLDRHTDGYNEVASKTANNGEGWRPTGSKYYPFTGRFDGQVSKGYEVRDLFVNCPPNKEHVGLFGYVGRRGVIENVRLVNVVVTGGSFVGGLVGRNDGTVSNSYASGSVNGVRNVGGLVGWNAYGTVTSNSYASGTVGGMDNVGGLVGFNAGTVKNSHSSSNGSVTGTSSVGGLVGWNDAGSTVSDSNSAGSVNGTEFVGGLVGRNNGKVSYSCSTGRVIGHTLVGGLVGYSEGDTVNYSYSSSNVTGTSSVGGLVGYNAGGRVSDSYSAGSVNGNDYAGGLVGHNSGGIVSKCYSRGTVQGVRNVGGLVAHNGAGGTVSNAFWDKVTSGIEASAGGTGKTTAEMKNLITFLDPTTEGLDDAWNIAAVGAGQTNPAVAWNIINAQTYPFLSWQPVA